MFVTNNSGMSIVMAVWALHSEYDRIDEENYISVTGLMKPIRQIVLSKRVPLNQKQNDHIDGTGTEHHLPAFFHIAFRLQKLQVLCTSP